MLSGLVILHTILFLNSSGQNIYKRRERFLGVCNCPEAANSIIDTQAKRLHTFAASLAFNFRCCPGGGYLTLGSFVRRHDLM